jgi:hypothetical protein
VDGPGARTARECPVELPPVRSPFLEDPPCGLLRLVTGAMEAAGRRPSLVGVPSRDSAEAPI